MAGDDVLALLHVIPDANPMIRTSLTHPLRIAELPVGDQGGAIGVTFAPGKYQEAAMTGVWERDLDCDLAAIRAWGASYLITLMEPWEFDELRIPSLPERAKAHGLTWYGLPITDGAAPDIRLLEQWKEIGPALAATVLAGGRLVVHCKGGLGRAGTVASMLLIDTHAVATADEAMSRVRAARPGAIETQVQEQFLREWATRRH